MAITKYQPRGGKLRKGCDRLSSQPSITRAAQTPRLERVWDENRPRCQKKVGQGESRIDDRECDGQGLVVTCCLHWP